MQIEQKIIFKLKDNLQIKKAGRWEEGKILESVFENKREVKKGDFIIYDEHQKKKYIISEKLANCFFKNPKKIKGIYRRNIISYKNITGVISKGRVYIKSIGQFVSIEKLNKLFYIVSF